MDRRGFLVRLTAACAGVVLVPNVIEMVSPPRSVSEIDLIWRDVHAKLAAGMEFAKPEFESSFEKQLRYHQSKMMGEMERRAYEMFYG